MTGVEVMQSQHSPDVLKSKAELLEPYGLSVYGEPLDSSSPLGKRISSFPRQRCIDFRPNQGGRPELKNVKDETRNSAAWAQTRGEQATHVCGTCAAGHGPFTTCVTLKSCDGQQFFDGSCANCHFYGRGTKCSFRASPATVSPAQLLKDFQSAGDKKNEQETQPSKTCRASIEDPRTSKKRRLDSPFPATTNSTPRASVHPKASINPTAVSSPSTTASDAEYAPHRSAQSKADGAILQCPLTATMYNDPCMLREVYKDLSRFTLLVKNRLREMEVASDPVLDLWGTALNQLDEVEAD